MTPRWRCTAKAATFAGLYRTCTATAAIRAVITNSPNNNSAGRAGYSRISNPTFQTFRGRVTARHMQSLLAPDAPIDEDFRINAEVGFFSDRNFLEQYFKRQFDTGLDQENLLYMIRQSQNQAFTVLAETNLQTFNTETQWYPRGDYYRLGDSFLGDRLTYYQHTDLNVKFQSHRSRCSPFLQLLPL